MSNLQGIKPGSSSVQQSPDSSRGFIGSTYRAARSRNEADKPITEALSRRPSITYAVGGSTATVSFRDNETTNRFCPHRRRGRGVRGRIKGLSRASRWRLLQRLGGINRVAFRAFGGKVFFITVTRPDEGDPADAKST
jgi:hypothetical protein